MRVSAGLITWNDRERTEAAVYRPNPGWKGVWCLEVIKRA